MWTAAKRSWRTGSAREARFVVAVLGLAGCWTAPLRGDLIVLRGGTQIEGKVVPDPKNKDRVQVWLLKSRNPLSFQKGQIAEVVAKPSALDGYIEKRANVENTPAAQFELGTWCEENKLAELAKLHYENALGADSTFEAAHKKLGHVYRGNVWLSREELSEAQGLVKYKGRWISADEKTKREGEAQLSAAQAVWMRRLKLLRQAILNGPNDRRREAESQLMSIHDADAVGPLMRTFGPGEPPRRTLLALVLSGIPGPASTSALVRRILDESDAEVRSVTFDHLKRRDDRSVPGQFIRALGSSDVRVINRAAWALGNLNALIAVPRLVTVLTTTEQRIVLEPPPNLNASTPAMVPAPGGTLKALNNYGFVVQSPPAVGPGVVAYGIAAVPWYQVTPGVASSAGIPLGMPIPQMPEPKVATFTYHNTEVLAALQKLCGQDFGYDTAAWREWVARSFNPNPTPVRRVPQP
jgi:hypothetical protein